MECDVEFTDEFDAWWITLNENEQEDIDASVRLLERYGPTLPFPYSSGLSGSKFSHMRELRIQHKGHPYRILYAFDPRQAAILLVGGDKTGNNDWYKQFIPIADKLYAVHLHEIGKTSK